jgi:exonuclease III
LSEVKKIGHGIEELSWCIFYYYGETKGQRGIGFLVNKKYKSSIIEFTYFSDRVGLLNMNICNTHLSFIQVYAPTEKAIDEEVDRFYLDIGKARDRSSNNQINTRRL